MSRDWSTAEEIEWEGFYRSVEGRELRQVFVDALPHLRRPQDEGEELVAVDLGCGDGKETLVLLSRGWTVLAVDGAPGGIARLLDSVPAAEAARLTTRVAPFAEIDVPAADLVYAGLSLPFCGAPDFERLWSRIVTALRPNGVFAGHFFGPRDTWFGTPDMTFHSRGEVEGLFAGFEVLSLREQDEDGFASSGPKHWHVFHVIARKRA